jgi:4-amino-4-deoxy-L-arabinose transferase-like glycosyltransferase
VICDRLVGSVELLTSTQAHTADDIIRVRRQPVAWRWVGSVIVAQAVLLLATSDAYGFHRDELYFRMLRPAWGYVDQPPLTPLIARLMTHLADQPWAVRLPAVVASAVSVLLIALIVREVGGGTLAQALAAWGYAFGSFPLIIGHVLITASIDATVWLGILLCVVRALFTSDERAWLWTGVLVGFGMYNKLLVVVLLASLLVGILAVGPRQILRSRWVALGAVAAVVIGLPNIVYQATNGWPQLSFGQALAAHNAGDVRVSMWYFLAILLGPPLVPVWVAGLVALWRRPQWRALRCLVPAFAVLVVLVFVMGSQPYYEFGLLSAVFAIGCLPTADWLRRGGNGRSAVVAALGGLNMIVSAVVGLPLVPLSVLGSTPIPAMNQTAADTVGWPAYAGEVATAYRRLPAATRRHTVVVATNYGEAGAIDRYGRGFGLPSSYSAHNQLYFESRPPASASVAIFVGAELVRARSLFGFCNVVGHLDNRVGVDNEEQGQPIAVCRAPLGGWQRVWPKLRHED